MVLQPESLRSLRKASDDGTGSGSGTDSPHAHGATDRELHHASLKVASWSSQNGELCHYILARTHARTPAHTHTHARRHAHVVVSLFQVSDTLCLETMQQEMHCIARSSMSDLF